MEKPKKLESIPGPRFKPGDKVKKVYWYDDSHKVFRKVLRSPEELKLDSTLRLKEVVSFNEYRVAVRITEGKFYFATYSKDKKESLKVWVINVEEYKGMDKVNLDKLKTSFTGNEAHRFLVDEFSLSEGEMSVGVTYSIDKTNRPTYIINEVGEYDREGNEWQYKARIAQSSDELPETVVFEKEVELAS